VSIQQGLAGASGGTSSAFNAAFPPSGTAAGAKDASGNMAALALDASGQLKAAANLRNSSGAEIGVLGTPLRVDPVGTTTQPVSVSGSVTVATHAVTQSGTWVIQPTTSGGLSGAKLVSAATTNATSVKNSAGQLYNVQAFNTNASARYLKLYNKASAPTVGTDTPVATWLIPPGASGFVIEIANGLAFALGIAFAITVGMADNDATAIGAGDVVVNLQYK
jgi:hypothetical protein